MTRFITTNFRHHPRNRISSQYLSIYIKPFIVDFIKCEVSLAGRPLNLTPVEFKLLGVLVKEPGRVFSRSQLIEKALGYDFDGFDRTIDVHILNLRRKLESDPSHPEYIMTVYGTGYKLSEVSSDT